MSLGEVWRGQSPIAEQLCWFRSLGWFVSGFLNCLHYIFYPIELDVCSDYPVVLRSLGI